jgi:hypothetical protein
MDILLINKFLVILAIGIYGIIPLGVILFGIGAISYSFSRHFPRNNTNSTGPG